MLRQITETNEKTRARQERKEEATLELTLSSPWREFTIYPLGPEQTFASPKIVSFNSFGVNSHPANWSVDFRRFCEIALVGLKIH